MVARSARQRDYAAEYARRVARAGGASELYAGRIAQAVQRAGPLAPRSVARGHGRETLIADVRSGRAALVFPVAGERGPDGRYKSITFVVQDQAGNQRTIRLTGKALRGERLRQLNAALAASGTAYVPSPSFDVNAPIGDAT